MIVDESFIDFACEGNGYAYWSVADEVRRFPNLMVVKSMSKDFGVAGIRAGYAVMAPERVRTLLDNGYLWNSSGLAEYFFDLYPAPTSRSGQARTHPVHPQLPTVLRRAGQDRGTARLPDPGQLCPGGAPERPERRGPRLADARPPRDLHPDLRRQAGARARQVRADRRRNRPENSYIIRSLRRMIG